MKRSMSFLAAIYCFGLVANVFGREWTDKTGQFRVEAEFRSIENDVLVLRKSDGTIVKVPFEKLIDSDRRFALTLGTISSIEFLNGSPVECRILQKSSSQITVLYHSSLVHIPTGDIRSIKENNRTEIADQPRTRRLPDLKIILVTAAVESWASDIKQIPATVIDNGVMRNVPYKSYRISRDYELNVYGDPDSPVCVEIGIHKGGLLDDDQTKHNCLDFICSILGDSVDRGNVRKLSLEKDKTVSKDMTFEVTPPTDPDAYGGWWISVYSEISLNSAHKR